MKLMDSKTYFNLAKGFAGECQARTRYQFIEYGARQEGYTALADIVKSVYNQEFTHARLYYAEIQKASTKPIANIQIDSGYPFKEKWNLVENLKIASEAEKEECEKVYPTYAEIADTEGFPDVARLFRNIAAIESCHMKLFQDLHKQMKSGTMYKKTKPVTWKCSMCGHEATQKEAWECCPVCHAKQGAVELQLN